MFALAPWDDVEAKWEVVFKVFLFLLVTAALLTSRERIHALIWVMVISLAYFGIKGGGFTLIGGRRRPGVRTGRHDDRRQQPPRRRPCW